jgi:serine O-acetyltransferase
MASRHVFEEQLHRFRMDVARWIRPQEVADLSLVTVPVTMKLLYRHLPLRAMAWYRLACWAKLRGIPGLPGYVQRRLLRHYGLELSPGNHIAGGLYIAHPVGCTLAADRIGANVTVVADVTFGARNEYEWPRIGNDVFIGAGARIIGGIEIGDGALVGANAVVVKDVPAGGTVVGIPARPLTSA